MPSSKDDLRTRLLAIFQEEASDHLRSIAGEMAQLDAEQEDDVALATVNSLFRTVHTLKGAARSLSIRQVEQVCHEIEDLCSALINQRVALDGQTRTILHDLTDDLVAVTTESLAGPDAPTAPSAHAPPADAPVLSDPAPPLSPDGDGEDGGGEGGSTAATEAMAAEVATAPGPAPVSASASRTSAPAFVRLEATQIQRLGMMAEDLLAPKLASRARLDEVRRLSADLAAFRLGRAATVRPQRDRDERDDLRLIDDSLRRLQAGLSEDERVLRSVVDQLVVELRQARMMPASDLLAVFPAMVAELGRELGKSVRWRAAAGELLIDRQIAELIKDPLLHIVRNAVDHGIEAAELREAAGKPAAGTISVSIAPVDGGRVRIEIADDGRGIDPAGVRQAAVRSRLHTREEAETLSDAEVMDLVFHPTLSTASMISAVSGRGLGLAIVRERAERLGGDARIVSSARGSGTVVALEVPAALANFRGIAVRAGETTVVCPLEAVERSVGLSAAECEAAMRKGGLQLDGEQMPIGDLAEVFGMAARPGARSGMRSGILLRQGGRRGVIVVDDIIGDCEVVVKELRPPLLRVRNILTTGLLGSGELSLVLRVGDVLDALSTRTRKVERPVDRRRRLGKARLLVVDDSITTRAMEVGLLEAAGYEVKAAADGMEAWTMLQGGEFDAVISDVDMPNMDGFELTEKVRADGRLKDVPIVLVTALERREDHDRGLRLGANAYMLKSAFDQSMLIDLVRWVL